MNTTVQERPATHARHKARRAGGLRTESRNILESVTEQAEASFPAPEAGVASKAAPVLPLTIEAAVIVPTLNEKENIGPLLDGILAADPRLHAIVVDDGSADGTGDAVTAKAGETALDGVERVHLIERGRKMGYASAVQDGMRYALEHGAQIILQMDADFSHDPKYLPAILEKSAGCDLVIGSRYVRGGGTQNWGIDRKILSGGANALVRTLLRLPARDCTAGFRCWKRALIENAGVLDFKVEGYAFLFLTLDRCTQLGAKVGEVPIIFVDRQYGKSKMSRRIIFEAARVLFRLWRQRWSRSPR